MANAHNIYIIYGFGEGPKLAHRIKQKLAAQGGKLVNTPEEADIILTHSGGCFFLPNVTDKTVVIVNPVCGSLWQLPFVMSRKIGSDFMYLVRRGHFFTWLGKTLWNLWYIISRVDRTIAMARKAPGYQTKLPVVQAERVFVINNAHDPWAKAVPGQEIIKHHYTYITFPGPHDDLWLHPSKYLDVLK